MKSPSLYVLIPKVKEVATVCTERSLDEIGFHWYAKPVFLQVMENSTSAANIRLRYFTNMLKSV